MEVRIDLSGCQAVDDAFRLTPEIVEEEMWRAMVSADALIEREVKDLTPTATGLTRGSIFSQVQKFPGGVIGVVGSAQPYIVYVELGTQPHFPPLAPIEDWVRVKFALNDEKEIERAAMAIARKIAARGTLAVGMFHRTFTRVLPTIETIFAAARNRIATRLAGSR
jgi:hypothetical protein